MFIINIFGKSEVVSAVLGTCKIASKMLYIYNYNYSQYYTFRGYITLYSFLLIASLSDAPNMADVQTKLQTETIDAQFNISQIG